MPTPTLAEYKEIAKQYHALSKEIKQQSEDKNSLDEIKISSESDQWSETSELSTVRNFFTGKFYNGRHASSLFSEKLGVKSDHANFIALIDRISKLGCNTEKLFSEIDRYENAEKDLDLFLNLFLNYFEDIQIQYENKIAIYDLNKSDPNREKVIDELKDYTAQQLRDLKKAINNLAQQHHILKRIAKQKPSVLGEKTPLLKIKYLAERKINDDSYYESKDYKQKQSHRRNKKIIKVATKIIGLLAAIGDGIIICNVAKVVTLLLLPSFLVWPAIILLSLAGIYTYYNLYSTNLYSGCKEILCGRFFKSINPKTQEYDSLTYQKIAAICLTILLSLGGGVCTWALVSYSTSTLFLGAVCMTGITAALPFAIPSLLALSFLYCYNISKSIKKWDENWAYYKNYFTHLTKEDIPRVIVDSLELLLAIALMTTLGMVGYVLFQGKGLDILKLWSMSNQVAAGLISAVSIFAIINASVKWIFGINRVVSMVDHARLWCSAPASDSKPELSPVQKADERCRTIYEYLIFGSLIFTALGKGVLYATVATQAFDQLGGPFHTLNQLGYATDITGASEFAYMMAPSFHNARAVNKAGSIVPFSIFSARANYPCIADANSAPKPPTSGWLCCFR